MKKLTDIIFAFSTIFFILISDRIIPPPVRAPVGSTLGVHAPLLCSVSALRAECLRCQFAPVAPLRSALHSNRTFITRGLYFIDRCAGVMFPVALAQSAAYEASLRVQSERSGGVPPLSIRGGRSTSFRSALEPNIYYSRSLLY